MLMLSAAQTPRALWTQFWASHPMGIDSFGD
jgi:hypothetical protein